MAGIRRYGRYFFRYELEEVLVLVRGRYVHFFPFVHLSFITIDDLTTNWNRLTLSNKEGPGCSLDEELSSSEFCIAIKFLTKRPLNIDAIAKTFTPLWRSKNGFRVRNLGDRKVLFVFDNKVEVDKVIQSEPWIFDKQLIVMERYDTNSSIEDLTLDRTTFWVQVHSLSIKFMNVKAAKKICEVLWKVIPTANSIELEGRNFIWVKVSMDVTGPLCRGRLVSIGERNKSRLASNMKGYQIFAIGAAALTMITRIVIFG
ncbi:hypothetical protein SO802_032925 [Lithocarpus litseifolius]|uniref:DUF4283 domain-containing protein n=1 Tax=Lithocarpus litseifolius TaxID=425828 RepID=A0AAW2BH09_9ROSI